MGDKAVFLSLSQAAYKDQKRGRILLLFGPGHVVKAEEDANGKTRLYDGDGKLVAVVDTSVDQINDKLTVKGM